MLKVLALVGLVVVATAAPEACQPSVSKAWGPNKTPILGRRSDGGFCRGDQIFIDQFDTLNTGIWEHEVVHNNGEFQLYGSDPENAYVWNSQLKVRPTINWNDNDNPVKSARMISQHGFSFLYGSAEVRARVPLGKWLWPAIWMKPRDSKYGQWPASGEIDIVETKGNAEWSNSMSSTLHWGPNSGQNKYMLTHWGRTQSNSYHDDYHLFQVEWTPDHIKFSVDNQETGSVYPPGGGFWELGGFGGNNIWGSNKMAPFDQPFYFILNVAVGGTNGWFADNEGGKPWKNGDSNAKQEFWNARDSWLDSWNIDSEQAALYVDYVKVNAL